MMANIINIFHKDTLPETAPPEYEITSLMSSNKPFEMLLYRRGITPVGIVVQQGTRISIPLVPQINSPSREVEREVKKFITDSIPYLDNYKVSVRDGVMAAKKFFDDRGTYITHALYSRDLYHHLDPVFDYITEAKCIEALKPKRTMILLPEPVCTGFLAVKDPTYSPDSRGRFGMMLSASNIFMITVP